MAVIVLKNADFSANNIGSIELKKAFNPITKQIIGRYGLVVDEDDEKQKALDDFVSSLESAGLLGNSGKIKSLCLPFMGTTVALASINALDGENFFTTDVSGSLSLTSGGLKPVANQSSVKVNLLRYYPSKPSGYHYAAYNITEETQEINSGNNRPINKSVFAIDGNVEGLHKVLSNSSYPSGRPALNINNVNIVVGDANYLWSSCLLIGNITNSGNSLSCNGQITKNTNPSEASGWANPYFGIYNKSVYEDYTAINATYTKASWAILSIGDDLTDAQCQAYNNAAYKLINSL